jgi:ABC-type enterochelin transport system permease subunit
MDSGTLHSIKLGLVTVVLFASACVVEIKAVLALVSAICSDVKCNTFVVDPV